MKEPTITVIVPCHNVAAYLKKCVKSIQTQTYPRLEILLIDDGSTDETLAICNQLANNDNRIRVIHQENKGSSATREIGVKQAKGELITFVDADDWIHPKMYRNMTEALLKENADIVQCGVCDIMSDGKEMHRYQQTYNCQYTVFGHVDGFCKLIEEQEWRSYMCNKIYRRQLFNGIVFPIGRGLDDDTSVMHQLFHKAIKSVYFKDEYYFYFHRNGSITLDKDPKAAAKKYYDRTCARLERYQFVSLYPEYRAIIPYLKSMTISMACAGLRHIVKLNSCYPNDTYLTIAKQIASIRIKRAEIDKSWISPMKWVEYNIIRFSPMLYFRIASLL